MALINFFIHNKSAPRPDHEPKGNVVLFNTKTKKKELFSALQPPRVRMYNCGPTVYAPAHIGNLRSYIFADTLRRTLRQAGFEVDQVINITDVGHLTSDNDDGADKMEEGARLAGLQAQTIAIKYTSQFLEDINSLNVETEDVSFPRATDHIAEQIALIKTLEEKCYTYKTSDGIYFDSSLFKNYGSLGGIDIEGLKEGARVEKNLEKKHPTDFALWKFSPADSKRQQEWPSPWGVGFPGWHIECSAMSMKYLGPTLDIHTGGIDHISIHHNNEIAQSEAATGRTYSRFWMHHEHIMIEGRKISKSLGNGITLSQIKDRTISPIAYRYFLLTGHYRTQMNFTWEALEGAAIALFRLRKYFVEKLSSSTGGTADENILSKFRERMNDDLDSPRAISILWETIKNEKIDKATKRETLLSMDAWLGLGLLESNELIEEMQSYTDTDKDLSEDIRALLLERKTARDHKDWAKADEIRVLLGEKGYNVSDTDKGQSITTKS